MEEVDSFPFKTAFSFETGRSSPILSISLPRASLLSTNIFFSLPIYRLSVVGMIQDAEAADRSINLHSRYNNTSEGRTALSCYHRLALIKASQIQ